MISSQLQQVCSKCHIDKPITEYSKNRSMKTGYHTICKECRKKANAIYYLKNKDRIKDQSNKYYYDHRPQKSEYSKEYYRKNKEYLINKGAEWAKENTEKVRGYKKAYKDKMLSTTEGKLRDRVSNILRYYLRNDKEYSTIEYVPFTIEELKQYLQEQFDKSMSWDNYGSYWHIDHIIPQSLYDFNDIIEIQKCWSLRNLRPLEARQNSSKNNTLDMKIVQYYCINDLLPS